MGRGGRSPGQCPGPRAVDREGRHGGAPPPLRSGGDPRLGLRCRPLQGAVAPLARACPRSDGCVGSCERVAVVTVDQRGDPPDPACAAWRRDRVTLDGTPRHAAKRGPPHTCSGFRPSACTRPGPGHGVSPFGPDRMPYGWDIVPNALQLFFLVCLK